jgi:peptidyl-prolyl cis-trans isomerase SurA
MKNTKRLLLLTTALACINTYSQKNEHTLLTIDDKKYSVEEFDFIYNKNNSFTEELKSKKEYLNLFVNYKLKVHEAIAQGYDTLPSFTKEFNYYKEELAKPYLSDSKVTDQLKQEAYSRLKTEVKASHLLIKLPPSPSPDDTLKAYNKITSILEKYNNGDDFNKLALQYSEDPSAKQNSGNLGYFSGFMMVYPFESAAYNTNTGEVSDIVRTSYGYHILKIHDKRDNPGELKTAHIMQMFPPNSKAEVVNAKKAKIDSIYQLVLNGEDFGTLAQKFSDDKNSARKNGELQWFGHGRMISEFSDPAYALDSIGAISKIIRTPYGFHIIKLLDKRGVKPYVEMEEEITKRIARDERAFQSRKVVVNRLKKEYNFTENATIINKLKEKAQDSQLANNEFYALFENSEDTVATFDKNAILVNKLVKSIKKNKNLNEAQRASKIESSISDFYDTEIIDYEKSKLTEKYPEYRFLVNEYHDGLLIFEISQKEIWNKAINDSAGIVSFYEANKSNYFIPEKLNGKAIFVKNKKTQKQIQKQLAKNPKIANDSLINIYGKETIKIIDSEFEKGEYKAIDRQIWNIKKSDGKVDKQYPYIYAIGEITDKKFKKLDESRGLVIADYQTEIEKNWIVQLKAKFNPVVSLKALKHSKK